MKLNRNRGLLTYYNRTAAGESWLMDVSCRPSKAQGLSQVLASRKLISTHLNGERGVLVADGTDVEVRER